MNLRTGHWNFALFENLSRIATVLKLNDAEAELLFHHVFGDKPFSLEEFCRYWCSKYGTKTICITLGGEGCAVFIDGTLRTFPGYTVKVVDTIGAGDAFAAAFLHGLDLGWPVERIARFANALGALVASRAGATTAWTLDECLEFTGASLSSNDIRQQSQEIGKCGIQIFSVVGTSLRAGLVARSPSWWQRPCRHNRTTISLAQNLFKKSSAMIAWASVSADPAVLYAAYERFVNDLVSAYVEMLPDTYQYASNLPEAVSHKDWGK